MIILAIFYTLRQGVWNVLYGLDCLGNAIVGGDPRETISSRLGKGKVARKPVHHALSYGVDFIFFILTGEKNHCVESIINVDDIYAISSAWDRYRKRK